MEPTDKNIQNLLAGKCSLLEAKSIIQALESNPETASKYFSEEEWQQFAFSQKLSSEDLEKSLQAIHSRLPKEEKTYNRAPIFYISAAAAAAAIIFFVVIGYWGKSNSNHPVNIQAATTAINEDLVNDTNHTNAIKLIKLEDGSSIELSPKSIVHYASHFPNNHRTIALEGTAFFEVAKDKSRPFEVQSAGFSTIALGTSFKVTAIPNDKQVTVQLYTGKVLVKKTNNDTSFKNVVLQPNEQLAINTFSLTSKMSTMAQNFNTEKREKEETSKQAIAWENYITPTQLKFDNTPLVDIVKVLEHHYAISIKYKKEQLLGIVFTGTFKSNDDVKNILATITSVNKLNLFRSDEKHFKIAR